MTAIYPRSSANNSPEQSPRSSHQQLSHGEATNGKLSPEEVTASVQNLRQLLEKSGSLNNSQISAQLQRLEQYTHNFPQTWQAQTEAATQNSARKQREQFQKLSATLHECSSLDRLLNVTTTELQKLLSADRVVVYRFQNSKSGTIVSESMVSGFTPSRGAKIPATCFGANSTQQYHQQAVVHIQDVAKWGFSPYAQQILEKYQIRSLVSVPILVEEQVWGLLVVQQCKKPQPRHESEINLLVQISQTLTLALQRAKFRRQLQQQSEQDNIVSKLIEKIQRAPDTDTIFRTTCQELRQVLKADRALVYRFNADYTGEVVAESVGSGWVSLLQVQGDDEVLQSDRTASDRCVLRKWATGTMNINDTYMQDTQGGGFTRGKQYTCINDVYEQDFAPCYIESLEKYQARAYMMVPIFQGNHLWGLLSVYQNDGPRNWQDRELNLMLRLAPPLGVALQQAEATERLSSVAEQEKIISRLIEKIQQAPNTDSIFRTTCQEVRQVLNADRSLVYRFNADFTGEVVAESVGSGWVSLLQVQGDDEVLQSDRTASDRCVLRKWATGTMNINDTYMQDTQGGGFTRGKQYTCINDVYEQDFAPCYIESLEKYQARAYIMVPIFQGNKLWGLLSVYQNDGPRNWQDREVNLMLRLAPPLGVALQQAEATEQVKTQADELAKAAERDRAVAKTIDRIRKSLDINSIFRTTTQEVRRLLQADRVGVYQFNEDWSGEFVAESVGSGWVSLVNEQSSDPQLTEGSLDDEACVVKNFGGGSEGGKGRVQDTYLQQSRGGAYTRGANYLQVNDIYEANFSPCYIGLLERFQARAYVTIPIFQGSKLWGLLATYQNSGPRQWQDSEVNVVIQIANQLGVALQQAEYLAKLEQQSQQLSETLEREKSAKEQLQQRAVQLLTAVRPSFEGDLTVRVPVTEDELGTIADAYNNTIGSLRKIVMQVQEAAAKVNETSRNSEAGISGLSKQAQSQLNALNQAIQELETAVGATEAVSDNAQKVEKAVQQAQSTVRQGDDAMNRTVDGIMEIRKTVSETTQKIKRLGESSQKITKVVNLISNFATQTNLLALNAAIEATRAGEYGRGFAVVADEVRSLARQSAAATTEIENLVQEIQQETSEVASAMDTGIQQVVSGTELVNETRENLNDIIAATDEISQLVEGISHSTQEQSSQSQSVTKTMEEVAEIARSTSAESDRIAAFFQELVSTAEELQSSVGKFKVK